jgi:hypothetical protein
MTKLKPDLQVGKAATDVDSLGLLANQLTRDFDLLASDSRGAAVSVQNMEVILFLPTGIDCLFSF